MSPLENLEKLSAGLQKIYNNKHHSDVTVEYGNQTSKAHKLVLALQSDVFATKFERWDTPEKPVDLSDENPKVVEAMLYYMYNFDYHLTEDRTTPMVFHAQVYAIAVKYSVIKLQELAVSKFQDLAQNFWNAGDFVLAVNEIYASTYKSERAFRNVILAFACIHIGELIDRYDFFSFLGENAELALEILQFTFSREGFPILENVRRTWKKSLFISW